MKCAIILAEGFETCEALITVDILKRAKVDIDMISITENTAVPSSQNIVIQADAYWGGQDMDNYDVLILPGGKLGTKNLEAFEPLKKQIETQVKQGKWMAAICAAPSILGHLGLLKNKKYTCFPEFDADYGGTYCECLSVIDGNIITGRGMGATIEFGRNIVRSLCGEEALDALDYGIQYEHRFQELNHKGVK